MSARTPVTGGLSAPPGFRVAAGSDIALYALCAALVLAFHFRLALPGRALVANDFRALFIALRGGLQQTLRHGELPLWQRGIFTGYPILGDIQPQLFNPLTWLTLPLDPARGVIVQSLLEDGWAVRPGAAYRVRSAPGIRVTICALKPADARRFASDFARALSPRAATNVA